MEKSFLELLEAEKRAVYNLKSFKDSTIDFQNQSKKTDDAEQKESCKRIASDYEKKAIEAEENLLQIRREIKKYISFLETL